MKEKQFRVPVEAISSMLLICRWDENPMKKCCEVKRNDYRSLEVCECSEYVHILALYTS